jgi:hypothetical protein
LLKERGLFFKVFRSSRFQKVGTIDNITAAKDPTRLFLGNFEEVADPCFQSYIAPGKAGFHVLKPLGRIDLSSMADLGYFGALHRDHSLRMAPGAKSDKFRPP